MYSETITYPTNITTGGGGSSAYWLDPVASVGALPLGDPAGAYRFVTGTNETYYFNGVSWVLAIADTGANVRVQSIAPTNPFDGLMWSDTATNIIYQYDSSLSPGRWISLDSYEVDAVLIKPGASGGYFKLQDNDMRSVMNTNPFIILQDSLLAEVYVSQSVNATPAAFFLEVHDAPFAGPAQLGGNIFVTVPIGAVGAVETAPPQTTIISAGDAFAFFMAGIGLALTEDIYVRARFKRLI